MRCLLATYFCHSCRSDQAAWPSAQPLPWLSPTAWFGPQCFGTPFPATTLPRRYSMHASSRPPHRLSTDTRQRPLPPKCSVKILKWIPRASREQAAAKLAKILDAIVSKDGHDDHVSWDRLLQFSARCFRVPARRAKRCSLASMVNGQLREEVDPPVLRQSARSKSFAKDPMAYLVSRVSSKLEQGDFKGAVRLACSDATIADNSSATFEELQQKHPHPHPASSIVPLAETTGLPPPITVSEEEIVRAIRSFPNDSAGGPDGLRSQHFKDMTGPITNGGAQALISALSRFVTVVLQGKVPMSIRPFLADELQRETADLVGRGVEVLPMHILCVHHHGSEVEALSNICKPSLHPLLPMHP